MYIKLKRVVRMNEMSLVEKLSEVNAIKFAKAESKIARISQLQDPMIEYLDLPGLRHISWVLSVTFHRDQLRNSM